MATDNEGAEETVTPINSEAPLVQDAPVTSKVGGEAVLAAHKMIGIGKQDRKSPTFNDAQVNELSNTPEAYVDASESLVETMMGKFPEGFAMHHFGPLDNDYADGTSTYAYTLFEDSADEKGLVLYNPDATLRGKKSENGITAVVDMYAQIEVPAGRELNHLAGEITRTTDASELYEGEKLIFHYKIELFEGNLTSEDLKDDETIYQTKASKGMIFVTREASQSDPKNFNTTCTVNLSFNGDADKPTVQELLDFDEILDGASDTAAAMSAS